MRKHTAPLLIVLTTMFFLSSCNQTSNDEKPTITPVLDARELMRKTPEQIHVLFGEPERTWDTPESESYSIEETYTVDDLTVRISYSKTLKVQFVELSDEKDILDLSKYDIEDFPKIIGITDLGQPNRNRQGKNAGWDTPTEDIEMLNVNYPPKLWIGVKFKK